MVFELEFDKNYIKIIVEFIHYLIETTKDSGVILTHKVTEIERKRCIFLEKSFKNGRFGQFVKITLTFVCLFLFSSLYLFYDYILSISLSIYYLSIYRVGACLDTTVLLNELFPSESRKMDI